MSHLVIATNSPRNIWYYTSQQDLPNFAVNEAKSFTISFHPMPQGEKRSLEYSAFQFPAIGEYLMKTSFFLTKGTQMCPVSFDFSKLSADLLQLKVEMKILHIIRRWARMKVGSGYFRRRSFVAILAK